MPRYRVTLQLETGQLTHDTIAAENHYHARSIVTRWIGTSDAVALVSITDLDRVTGRRRAEVADTPVLEGMILAAMFLLILLLMIATY